MKYVIIGIIVLLFLKAGWGRLEAWLATKKDFDASKYSLSFNWSDTLPGKAIDAALGAGWANWIMWLAVAILIYWLIATFVLKSKGSGDGLAGGSITVMGFIALAAIILSAVGSNYIQEEKSTVIQVNLTNKGEREPVDVNMTLNNIARVQGGYPKDKNGRVIADGVTAYGICGRVKEPGWILRDASTPKQHMGFLNKSVGFFHDMELTDDMKKFLVKEKVPTVTVSFYLVLTTVGAPPNC